MRKVGKSMKTLTKIRSRNMNAIADEKTLADDGGEAQKDEKGRRITDNIDKDYQRKISRKDENDDKKHLSCARISDTALSNIKKKRQPITNIQTQAWKQQQ